MGAAAIKEYAIGAGASLVGIADLATFADYPTLPPDLLTPYTRAVSMAIAIDREIVSRIDQLPTKEYAAHCRQTNALLNALGPSVADWIERQGHNAYPIPASEFIDKDKLMGHISHKAVARMAGIGWQGKQLLIISPEYGPHIRLITVLTDMPLAPDGPVANRCASCHKCADACPVGAIRNVHPAADHYASRDEALEFEKCRARTKANSQMPEVGHPICGVCIKACPWGK